MDFLIKAAAYYRNRKVGSRDSLQIAILLQRYIGRSCQDNFLTSLIEKVQENVPLKTPEVTEQLELACIATCLLPVYCKF